MKVYEQGVLNASEIFLYTPSANAKEVYFYPLCTGHYFCDGSYSVNRQSCNSFLIIYVCAGSGFLENDGKQLELKVGSLAIIDCYAPHRYYTTTEWEFYWVHFDGVMARQYYEIATRNGPVFILSNSYHVERSLKTLFESYKKRIKVSEAFLSKCITDILTELIVCSDATTVQKSSASFVEDTIEYVSENANNPITVAELAERVFLSTYYFIRVFKRETGYTPHEYIVKVRLNFARFLLKTTDVPIKEIAYRSGFNSESGFCTAFKKASGMTPKNYRLDKLY